MLRLALVLALVVLPVSPGLAFIEAKRLVPWCEGREGENMRLMCLSYLTGVWEATVTMVEACKNKQPDTDLAVALFLDHMKSVPQPLQDIAPAAMIAKEAFRKHAGCDHLKDE